MSFSPNDFDGITHASEARDYHARMDAIADARDAAREAERREEIETSQRMIGGVFVLQNMGLWQSLSSCTCWPID